MASCSESSMFFNILLEEYKKKPQNVDVVGEKKKKFSSMLDKAHDNLMGKQYIEAKECYFQIMQYLKNEPYPDELGLSEETKFAIECCMCFLTFMDMSSNITVFETCPANDLALDLLKNLNEVHSEKLFVKYLNVLLYIGSRKWVITLYWCNIVEMHKDDGFKFPPVYEIFLPSQQEIMENVDLYKLKAFHHYGIKLIKTDLLKSNDSHYEFLSNEIDQLISNKLSNLNTPVSETDLHILIHQFSYPLWQQGRQDEHYIYYYDEKYISNCEYCKVAFHHCSKYGTLENKNKGQTNLTLQEFFQLHNSLIRCPFLDRIEAGVKTKLREIEDMVKAPAKKKKKNNSDDSVHVAQTQTDRVKIGCRYVQTETPKHKNVEVQVNFDSVLLNTMLDIKNRLMVQEKKEDGSVKLHKKMNEMNDLLVKASAKIKTLEEELLKNKKNDQELEMNKLKEQLSQSEKQKKVLKEKNVCLQKQLVEQVNDKYNIHKNMYKTNEKKSQFMVYYLKELSNFLSPNSIPNDATIKQNINIWEAYLKKIQEDLDQLTSFYGKVRADMLHSDKFSARWPDIRELPRDEDNIIFKSFTPAIKHIVNIEEKLFSQCKTGLPLQPQQFVPIPQNLQYTNPTFQQFVPQSSSYYAMAPSPNYSNAPTSQMSLPPNNLQQLQQPWCRTFSEMQRQQCGTERAPLGNQKLRASKSSECLSKAGIEKHEMKVFVEKKKKKAPPPATKETPQANNGGYQEKEKILYQYVVENCRGASEDDVLMAMLQVVDEKGTLSKLPKEKIVEDVKAVIRKKKQSAWVTPKSPHVDWQNDHSENNCSICFEDFSKWETYTLRCQHEYHKKCIKRWLKTSSVCPICRVHSVIDEEFPPLH